MSAKTSGQAAIQCTECGKKAWRGVLRQGHFPPFLPAERRLTSYRCLCRTDGKVCGGPIVMSGFAPGERPGVAYPISTPPVSGGQGPGDGD